MRNYVLRMNETKEQLGKHERIKRKKEVGRKQRGGTLSLGAERKGGWDGRNNRKTDAEEMKLKRVYSVWFQFP